MLGAHRGTWPLGALAQQSERMRRIGVVMAYAESDPNGRLQIAAFREQLQKLGWTEGSGRDMHNMSSWHFDPIRTSRSPISVGTS